MQEQPPTIVNNYITITDSVITRSSIGEVKVENLPPPEKAGYVDALNSNKMKIQGKMAVSELARLELESEQFRTLGCTLGETSHEEWENHCRHESEIIKNLDENIEENQKLQAAIRTLNNNVLDLTFGKRVLGQGLGQEQSGMKRTKIRRRPKKIKKSLVELEEEGRKFQEEIDKIPVSFGTRVRMIPCYATLFFFTLAAFWEYKVMSFLWR